MWTTSRGIDKECIVSTASRDATPAPVPAPKLALRVELLPWERWLPLSNCTPALASRSATSSPSDVRGSSSSGVKPFRPPLMCSLALGDILHKAGILVSTLDGAWLPQVCQSAFSADSAASSLSVLSTHEQHSSSLGRLGTSIQ